MKLTEENYVETAEKAIKEICGKKDRRIGGGELLLRLQLQKSEIFWQ